MFFGIFKAVHPGIVVQCQSTAISRQKLRVRVLSSESYDKTPSIIYHCPFSFSVYHPPLENLYSYLLRHKTCADDELGITLPYMLSNLKSYDSGA